MKTLLGILILAGLAASCQHHSPPTKTVADAPLVKTARPEAARQTADRPEPSGQAEEVKSLQNPDFSSLLQTVHSDEADYDNHAQNGFFGPTHYRIEMAMTRVWRDTANPALYHLQGLSRYKKIITPFVGEFTVGQTVEQPLYTAKEIAAQREQGIELRNESALYTTIGSFELREDSTHRGAGVFRGKLAIDWKRGDYGRLETDWRKVNSGSHGGGVWYDGTWTNNKTQQTYPVQWVENFSYVAEQVLPEFNIGEREMVINPKYVKLGWPEFWENEEWWADSPKASLNL
ncbi:hypothetical protein Q5H93_18515 [Hymenobacter sp. ASUV-10]|uniref:Uncharacterized protein n=1 Tax=Hymenobacter aranciens TaxID=3063996 RepID=A0ABT9BG27_9BACT|nr:hypothetical protein [Hymenobacter sp. ASUV-10]MDO7876745.1 hypothetical protein [Hymenobacter sp. ASUV-10]